MRWTGTGRLARICHPPHPERNPNAFSGNPRRMKLLQRRTGAPPPLADTRRTTEKYSLLFSFCARPIFSSLNEKSIFLWCIALTSKAAGLASIFCKGMAEFPPHPSAIPLRGRTEFLAATLRIAKARRYFIKNYFKIFDSVLRQSNF